MKLQAGTLGGGSARLHNLVQAGMGAVAEQTSELDSARPEAAASSAIAMLLPRARVPSARVPHHHCLGRPLLAGAPGRRAQQQRRDSSRTLTLYLTFNGCIVVTRPPWVCCAFHVSRARPADRGLPATDYSKGYDDYLDQDFSEFREGSVDAESESELTQEDCWDIIRAFFDSRGLVRQQLDSFNDFLGTTMQELVQEVGQLTLEQARQYTGLADDRTVCVLPCPAKAMTNATFRFGMRSCLGRSTRPCPSKPRTMVPLGHCILRMHVCAISRTLRRFSSM